MTLQVIEFPKKESTEDTHIAGFLGPLCEELKKEELSSIVVMVSPTDAPPYLHQRGVQDRFQLMGMFEYWKKVIMDNILS